MARFKVLRIALHIYQRYILFILYYFHVFSDVTIPGIRIHRFSESLQV